MSDSILVTGVAGSGKSTVCRELQRRGYAAYDIESITGLFAFVDKTTGKPATDHWGDDPEWFERHSWRCDKEKLGKLMLANQRNLAFYCGIAANLDDLLPLFDRVVVLTVDAATLRKRLSERPPSDFGHAPAIQEWLLGWRDEWEDKMKRLGAVMIGTDRGLHEVVDEIIRIATDRRQ
jgi:dephospho-CoA kinase